MRKKILILAHGHPAFSKGGGEIAAYNLYKTYNELGYDAYFVGAHKLEGLDHGGTPFSTYAPKEILFKSTMQDYFLLTMQNRGVVWNEFQDLLDYIDPDIIHFHHYIHLGIELLRGTRNWIEKKKPSAALFMTLHEYIAICPNNGQMIKTTDNKLCYTYNPVDCKQCFPDRSTTEFKMRELHIRSYLETVDHFVSPSYFLKDRYVTWGMDADKISVIDNGQLKDEKLAKRTLKNKNSNRSVFAYFGQINPFKGLDILLESLEYLPKKFLDEVDIQIHGSGLEHQSEAFQVKVRNLMDKYQKKVKFFGPYDPDELANLMKNVDWVVMPSIWWENSPLVIQEALKFGRPLIVSDIGGMKEKVKDGRDGLHFHYKNPQDLALAMQKAAEPEFYDTIYKKMATPLWLKEAAEKHLGLYDNISKHSLV